MPDQDYDQPRVRIAHVRALGLVGTLLAILTMGAAVGVGFLAFFGTTLLASLLVKLAWPLIFSVEFTQWVFGAPSPVFWKLFLFFVVVRAIAKLSVVRREK